MSENLKLWDAVSETDPRYTKQFNRGGGFKGTSTNATWLAMKVTEQFGPMGINWGVDILDEQYRKGAPIFVGEIEVCKEVVHVLRVKLWYVMGGKRGEIVQYGQTTFVGKNKYGPFTDEEAPKKSLTDGMSKCLSLLGFAADIHLGRYDDNKYINDLRQKVAQKEAKQQEVQQSAIIDEADKLLMPAAKEGVEAFRTAWRNLGKEDRERFSPLTGRYKKIAEAVPQPEASPA